jgi:segregation and condensation protein B
MTDDRYQLLRLLEAILFAATEPMSEDQLAARMPEGADINGLLQELKDHYANRGVHLMGFEDRWAFRTAPDLASKFHIEKEVVRKLSRAAVETLAIIAYHQPVTRAEIEDIRGVAISKGTLDMLLEIGWIRPKGRRETPGRPVTWATTDAFLEHFGLETCDALPGVEELKAAGLLDARATVATLGAQGTLPNGATVGEDEAEDEEGNISDMLAPREEEPAEGEVADDDYESEVLRRAEAKERTRADADGVDPDRAEADDAEADTAEADDAEAEPAKPTAESTDDEGAEEDSDDLSGSTEPKAAAQSA